MPGNFAKNHGAANQLIGTLADVFRSGDKYKAVGEVVKRADYPELSAAFPRNGSVSTVTIPSAVNLGYWRGIAFGAGIFIAVGLGTSSGADSATDEYALSKDGGATWIKYKFPSAQRWAAITFGAGKFLAISTGTVAAISTDGVNWVEVTTFPALAGTYRSVTYANGKFVAVARIGSAAGNNFAYSTDGSNWTAGQLPGTSAWPGNSGSVNVVFGNGVFHVSVAGSVAAATSADGVNWMARTLPVSGFNGVAFGNGVFVATAFVKEAVYTSTDGISWAKRQVPFAEASNSGGLIAAIFGDNTFVVGSNIGGLAMSSDGISWRVAKGANSFPLSVAAYGAGAAVFASIEGAGQMMTAYVENMTDSEYLYLSGTAGQFVRVK